MYCETADEETTYSSKGACFTDIVKINACKKSGELQAHSGQKVET